ncbi:MAG: hypothetical protein PHE89_02745 [Alphaproteobacteria bacterium]|nr:hypothetical protein [Alphaproteobacteria bacterium]
MPEETKITGYKPLSDEQKALMNEIKAKGNELGALFDELFEREDVDKRSLSIAKTEAQTALMWANRAVAQPTTFC